MGVTVDHAISSLVRQGHHFTKLLRCGIDASLPVEGLTWTVHQLGAHLASGVIAYREMVEGAPSAYTSFDERMDVNQRRLDAEMSNDIGALADTIDAELARIVDGLRDRESTSQVPWHGGTVLPITPFIGAMVGEFMFHGLDLAKTANESWPLDRRDALPVVDCFNAATPFLVDPAASQGVKASIEVRYRRYETATFRFDDGSLDVRPGRTRRPDAHMSVSPVGFLLVGYKRISLARLIASGGAVAWGRKPWLALRFAGLFEAP